jgi:diadenosine tetraphosphate (Ap4A) HIT family hydrolase
MRLGMENVESLKNHKNPNSHLTAKERNKLSFPVKWLKDNKLLSGEILDFGCGFGSDVELLSKQEFSISGYDKHYFPNFPENKFDTILCVYVLNVLLPEEQSDVIMEVSSLLKPNGRAYFIVRRDITYEGFRTHKIHQKKTYQCLVKLPFKSIFVNDFCEIYEFQLFNNYAKKESTCPFCNPDIDREILMENVSSFAIYDKFPVNPGHVLVIPKRHVSHYFELSVKEQTSCTLLLNKIKKDIDKRYQPDAYTVGINVGVAAGQTVPHVHIHLIPRYLGDVEHPEGGVRGVIPERQKYR